VAVVQVAVVLKTFSSADGQPCHGLTNSTAHGIRYISYCLGRHELRNRVEESEVKCPYFDSYLPNFFDSDSTLFKISDSRL